MPTKNRNQTARSGMFVQTAVPHRYFETALTQQELPPCGYG